MQVFNQTQNVPLITRGRIANSFWSRLRGLLGAVPLQKEEGLILVAEKSIHTFFMSFPIDVVYVDKTYRVIRADANMVPYRIGPIITQSAYVLELAAGTIAATATKVGDQLKFDD